MLPATGLVVIVLYSIILFAAHETNRPSETDYRTTCYSGVDGMREGSKRTRGQPHLTAPDDSVSDTYNYRSAATAAVQSNVRANLLGDEYRRDTATEPSSRTTEYR